MELGSTSDWATGDWAERQAGTDGILKRERIAWRETDKRMTNENANDAIREDGGQTQEQRTTDRYAVITGRARK
jgi:hypothetical protein